MKFLSFKLCKFIRCKPENCIKIFKQEFLYVSKENSSSIQIKTVKASIKVCKYLESKSFEI